MLNMGRPLFSTLMAPSTMVLFKMEKDTEKVLTLVPLDLLKGKIFRNILSGVLPFFVVNFVFFGGKVLPFFFKVILVTGFLIIEKETER
jgi:hypothetical protein